jgi:hypothetical protein
MGAVLRKTSYSANIKERRDYSCAIYDAAGETVAMGDHMPVHLGAMPLSVRHALDALRCVPGMWRSSTTRSLVARISPTLPPSLACSWGVTAGRRTTLLTGRITPTSVA